MGGISVYHHLCQTGLKSKIPVIVLTARSGLKELFEVLEVDGFLSKPFEMEVLREKVRLILNRQDEKQPPKPIVRRRSDAADPIALSKGCMVLFEDNLSTAETITVALQEEGIKILRAASVLQGIQLISRENPFLIAISRQIAELPGDLVAYKIKKMPQGEAAAIYLYGGQDDEASGGSQDVRPVCERMGVRFIAEHGGVSSLIFEAKRVLRDLPANS